jgi:hypothetical protein
MVLLWHSGVYVIPSRDRYLRSTCGPESLVFPFALCEYTFYNVSLMKQQFVIMHTVCYNAHGLL